MAANRWYNLGENPRYILGAKTWYNFGENIRYILTRKMTHERLILLKEEIEAGRIKFAAGLPVIESLQKVRYGPDGKVDPSSVEANVRALANAIAAMKYREQLKEVPLIDVQSKYFGILDQFFGHPFSEMKKHNATPHQIAKDLASRGSLVQTFASEAQEFVAGIREFWDLCSPVVRAHLEDSQSLKSIYGGDIFPSYTTNIACSAGLYVDTIVLPDPLLRNIAFIGTMTDENAVYYLAKHALNALNYRELALADVETPIIVIAPDESMLDQEALQFLQVSAEADMLVHCSHLFGQTYSELEELEAFFQDLSKPNQLFSSIVDRDRLLFDTEWSEPLEQQLQRYIDEIAGQFKPLATAEHTGTVIKTSLYGRMMQVNDIVFKSSQYNGVPLIDAPTSWQYLLWKYEYDRERSTALHPDIRDVLVLQALQAQGNSQLGLISGIPPSALIELRRKGALADLRQIIRDGINQIDSASPSSLLETTETDVPPKKWTR